MTPAHAPPNQPAAPRRKTPARDAPERPPELDDWRPVHGPTPTD